MGFVCGRSSYRCRLSFTPKPDEFSPVPYFLLCRTIELQFKALHFESNEQLRPADVKSYSHDLVKSYNALPVAYKVLSPQQFSLLNQANEIYKTDRKGFEYFHVGDALRGFSNFPDLNALDALTEAIIAR